MQLIDPKKNKDTIIEAICRHGFNCENNYYHYMYDQTKNLRNVFILDENGYGVMAVRSRRNVWYLFPNGILAPDNKRFDLLMRFIDFAFENDAKKVTVELLDVLKDKLCKEVKKNSKYKTTRMNYYLTWPIFHMKEWDHTLAGKRWKKIRNIVNYIENAKKVDVVDSRTLDPDLLKSVVDNWIESRNAEDYVSPLYYYNLIENGFLGFDHVRTVCINDTPTTITAGWKIPNTNGYYSAIGITDYEFDKHLGIYANIDDLRFLKNKGYGFVDFGGSDEALLSFKKKFMPNTNYRTYVFSIKKK